MPRLQGGLSIPYLRSKCEALQLKQALRIVTSSKNCRDHLGYWFGDELGSFGFDMNFRHFSRDSKGRRKAYKPKYFKNMCELFLEGLDCERFSLENINGVTTKSIFLSFTETMPPESNHKFINSVIVVKYYVLRIPSGN